ncbi:glutamate-cysteine ligase family protein [Streptomyces sp. NBC_01288]|uniref:glutamate-cysteine ligase family protein n=1 Tax=Streptomyces sp. NBC_01288 TaxID=2903814 RepID=UPI002E145C68|nr:glutamate-cysteine ligase family protein [Streptomyces sp. NBC_01288]
MELEWFVLPVDDPGRRASAAELTGIARLAGKPLPEGSRISWEPGGQLELSGPPRNSLQSCIDAVAADLAVLRSRAQLSGMRLLGAGLDRRPPRFTVALPRYRALKDYYAQRGGVGDALLCNTASVQVNVDAGDGSDGWRGRSRRWLIANALGPVLMAVFANSPVLEVCGPRETSAVSGRQLLRFRADRFRSGPLPPGSDPRSVWTRYAFDAQVVSIRRPGPAHVLSSPYGAQELDDYAATWESAPAGLSLGHWLRGMGPRAVRAEDVFHHLKSLVPPVRACGHLELRMIDAQAADDWVVPVAVVAALMDDRTNSDALSSLIRAASLVPSRHDWINAARNGLADPELRTLARTLIPMALAGVRRLGVSPEVSDAVERFAENYTLRGRSPAQSRLPNRMAVA